MIKVKCGTKQAEGFIRQYEYVMRNYGQRGMHDVYKKCSQAKMSAFMDCRALQKELDGRGGTVVSATSFSFTYAFTFYRDGEKYLMYITKAHNYEIEMEGGDD